MKNLNELNRFEAKYINGGDRPISDWVACKVRAFIDRIKDGSSANYEFNHCGRGNNVRC